MTIDYRIINGTIFTDGSFKKGGLAIENERIIKIGKEPNLPKASATINANDALIIPGVIDIHVHMRDFEQQYKATLVTGTRSAVAGGVTSVFDMPNNKPPTNSVQRVIAKHEIIQDKAAANIGFYSLLPESITEMDNIINQGIFGFKIYPASSMYPPKDNATLKQYLEKIAKMDLPLIIHPDNGFAEVNEKNYLEKNLPSIDAFLKAHNQIDEGKAFQIFIQLAKELKFKLHCAHITAKETVEEYEKNINDSFITGEICPHHLLLTIKDLERLKSEAKCLPPLRSNNDQKALWKALVKDEIKIITTDHAPHSYNEKHCEFEAAASGIHGLETLVPLMFTAVKKGKISFEQLIPKMTQFPAEHLKLEGRGILKENYFADITVVAKEKETIDASTFQSKAKWTPFNGYEINFKPKYVFVNGFLAKDDEYIDSKATSGKILKRKIT